MDFKMIVTYVFIDIFCIIMAAVMGININSDFGSEFEVKALRKAMISYCGFLVSGLVWLLTQNGYLIYNVAVLWIANCLSLMLMSLSAFYWFVFAVTKLSGRSAFSNKKIYQVALMPIYLSALIYVLSPVTGWAFTITRDGQYNRGPLFVYVSSVSYFYDFLVLGNSIYYGIRAKQYEMKKLCRVIGLFIVFPMVAGIIQLLVSGTPIIAPATIIALFIVFVTIQSSQIYNDALTGLNNRKRAIAYLDKELASAGSDHPVVVYMIDVDRFKLINDRHGHVEGDRALRIVSDAISRIASKNNFFAARYGGDEFIIIDSDRKCQEPQNILSEINEQLNMCCIDNKLSYELKVSGGYTEVNERNKDINEVIDMADRKLYEDKARLAEPVRR